VPALAGFVTGYLAYDSLHFYVHHATPANWIGRYLRRRHMHHHFRDDTSWFGVSAPWWDTVFVTRPARGPDID
jgi:sterol desaturase/sphingolipid hydroxylase (fatty acid hydroxylase superfamily)